MIDQGRLLAVGSLEELRAQTGKEWLEDVFRALVQDAGTEAPAATPPANEG